ncbi:MAG: SpoVR family protein [bacterium]|nr:SpoVR family protein [bacterium]
MQLIDQHTKAIMEGCKERARAAGLVFLDETLEYVVTNRDMLELSPKVMIPTLYDYWVHDVQVLREKGKYELYPSNPYETVINTRPAISFYNDNNPDWLNVMIFYHVLAHIDFFQNNLYFSRTREYDFTGRALADKRAIASLRSEHGRWVDYVIEFSRGLDNLVGHFNDLSCMLNPACGSLPTRINYYFDIFLQSIKKVRISEYVAEINRYNDVTSRHDEATFFSDVENRFPEFNALFKKHRDEGRKRPQDLLEFVLEHSERLNKEENRWMKTVLEIVRQTSLYFQPQIRTKIMNEGWASYWHEELFLQDDRITGHEVDFARINAAVTSMPRVGLNPYALGMRLFNFIEEAADRGCYDLQYDQLSDQSQRARFDQESGRGRDYIFDVRENYCDFLFINSFITQDFVTHFQLFEAGKRLDEQRMVWQWYVKSRKAADYKRMVMDSLYHPPHIDVDIGRCRHGSLYLVHKFEGKPLVREFIENTLLGLEYLWGAQVRLETSEVKPRQKSAAGPGSAPTSQPEEMQEIEWRRVVYTMRDRRLSRTFI